MKKLFVTFRCDVNHNKSSYVLIGVWSSKDIAVKKLIIYSISSEEGSLNDNEMSDLMHMNQTQTRGENYVIQEIELDEFIESNIG